jgi:drug/metabolite transporter (DMT)-like permease
MRIIDVCLLLSCALAVTIGQILLKIGARDVSTSKTYSEFFFAFFAPHTVIALCIYVLTSFIWIWLLSRIPLSIAYPFLALSFALTPLAAMLWLHERVSWSHWLGVLLVFAGVVLITTANNN